MTEPRRFVQIHCASDGHYVAVADDGTAWEIKRRDYSWKQLPALPHHAARRPKPPRLAEEALEEIQQMEGAMYSAELGCDFTATRAALERLQHLEQESNDN